jgi:transcriptional regulator with XRE-family HTH domain
MSLPKTRQSLPSDQIEASGNLAPSDPEFSSVIGIASTLDGIADPSQGQRQPCRNFEDMKKLSLHTNLRKLIAAKKMSARAAAKEMGIPVSTLNGYLQPDRYQLDPTHLLKIALFFKVSVDFLLTGVELDMSPQKTAKATKVLFSKWVKLTLEEIEAIEASKATDE